MGGEVSPVQLFRQFYMDGEFSILGRSIEDGGSARIYRGTWWQRHNVAVKVFDIMTQDKLFHSKILMECQVWKTLKHEHVLEFLGVHLMKERRNAQGKLGIVTPLCEKGTSATCVARNDTLSIQHRLDFIRKLANAVAYLHEQGVAHRDIKLSNILVKDDGTPAICDFGSARLMEMHWSNQPSQTPRYMPPEVVHVDYGEAGAWALSLAGDVWSFAMTALELMTGRLPYFRFVKDIHIMTRVRLGQLPAHRDYKAVPQGVWDILVRCWAYDFTLRPTMAEVKEYLDVAGIGDDIEPASILEFKQPEAS